MTGGPEAARVVLITLRGRAGNGRATRPAGGADRALGGSLIVGWLMRAWVPTLDTPAADAFTAAGVVVIWVGLAVRVWRC